MMDNTNNQEIESGQQKKLINLGIIDSPSRNKAKTILKKLVYVLSHYQRWPVWTKTFYLDFKYGLYFARRINNGNFSLGRWGAINSCYAALDAMFSQIKIRENDVLVDVGCGQGRVLNFFLHHKYKNKLIGVEVDPVIAEQTKKRLCQYSQIEIIIGTIEDKKVLPLEGTVFYLFNPFSEAIMKKFSDNLAEKIQQGYYKDSDRPLIIYYYCYFLHVFEDNPIWIVKKLDTQFDAAIIIPRKV